MKVLSVRSALALLLFLVTTPPPAVVRAAPATPPSAAGTRTDTGADRAAASVAPRPALPSGIDAGGRALRGPVDDARYVVGPGDVFAVALSTESLDLDRLPVTPEGDLVLPGLGTVRLAGLTLRDAKRRVIDTLGSVYRNVEITVSLVALRRVQVHVTGAVAFPGTYEGTAEDVVGQMVAAAGGLAENGSSRRIRITHRGGEERFADLVRYERVGDAEANPPILDGDLIFVPYAKTQVSVEGAVERPGVYEFVEGDTIGSLLEIAGGPRRDARSDSLEVRRFLDAVVTRGEDLPLTAATRALPVGDGDQVYVRFGTETQEPVSVTVEGQVRFPGPYGINEGKDRLSDVIARAGGFTADASLREAQLVRTAGAEEIDLEFERLKAIPVQDMSKSEYAYFKGKSRERKGVVVVDFTKLAERDPDQDRLLREGDRIVVPERRETVTVSGNVTFPGLVTYEPGRRADYYIAEAGGFGANADRSGTRVIRVLTGEWETRSEAGEIVPGDEIWVPEEPDRDWWQFTQDAVRFAASLATIYLVIDQATRN